MSISRKSTIGASSSADSSKLLSTLLVAGPSPCNRLACVSAAVEAFFAGTLLHDETTPCSPQEERCWYRGRVAAVLAAAGLDLAAVLTGSASGAPAVTRLEGAAP